MKKKLLFTVMALICALTCALGLAACNTGEVKIGFTYELNADGASYAVTGVTYDGSEKFQSEKHKDRMPAEITIPSEYKGKPVTEIKSLGQGCEGVTKVNVPDCVVALGGFEYFKDLTSFTIGDNVKKIGYGAFAGLTSLEISLGENSKLERVAPSAFRGTKIKSFKAPATLKLEAENDDFTDSDYLFDGCTELEYIDLSAITKCQIGKNFATGCKKLKTVILPNVSMRVNAKSFDIGSSEVTTVYWCKNASDSTTSMYVYNGNAELLSCIASGYICYYSETEPDIHTLAYRWHYVDGVPVKW